MERPEQTRHVTSHASHLARCLALTLTAASLCLLSPATLCRATAREQNQQEPAQAQMRLKNFQKAAELLNALAAKQNPSAEYLLGTLYRSGLGVPADNEQARHWIESAAQHGHADAAYAMAALLADAPTPDTAAIQQWLQRAASGGHVLATRALADGIQPQRFQPNVSLHDIAARRAAFWLAAAQDDAELLGLLNDGELIKAQDEFGRTALSYAARQGATTAVTLLLKEGATVDQADAYGITPLMLAAGAGHDQVITQLLQAGATANSKDRVSNTALMYAAGNQRTAAGLQLLNAGADIHIVNAQGWSALDWALHANSTELANKLRTLGLSTIRKAAVNAGAPSIPLQHAANGNDLYRGWPDLLIAASRNSPELFNNVLKLNDNAAQRGPNGETPLLVAVQSGNTTAIDRLLAGGPADAMATLRDANETPLSWAVRHNQLVMVQLLLGKGISPDMHGKHEEVPLLDAVRQDSEPLLSALLKAGAKVGVSDSLQRSPLMLAVQMNHATLLRALLTAGANPNDSDQQGRSALWLAAANGADDCVRLLINARVNLEKRDSNNTSALMVAAAGGHASVAEQLLTAGASIQATVNSNTPLMLAAANGHEAIVKRLLGAGARPDIQNKHGDTALMFAVRAGQTGVTRVLLAAGASSELRNKNRASAQDIAGQLGFAELVTVLKQGS